MKKKIQGFFKGLLKLILLAFAVFTIWTLAIDQESQKWSRLLNETQALIPQIRTEKQEDTIKRVCDEEGVPWIDCILVANCESKNDKFFKEKMRQGYDRGIFAINSYHYKQIEDDCAFNVECASRVFAQAVKAGRASDWLCYRLLVK